MDLISDTISSLLWDCLDTSDSSEDSSSINMPPSSGQNDGQDTTGMIVPLMAIHRTQSSEIISRESESESVVSSTGTIVHHNINDAAIVIRDADGDALYLSPTVRAANTIFNRTLPSDENLQYQATTSEEADPTKDSRVDSSYNLSLIHI